MEKEERMEIRGKLYNSMLSQGVLVRRKNDVIFIKGRLSSFSEIELFDSYCSQFDSQKEAVYCIVHNSDFTEHVCPICGKKVAFSVRHNFYRESCGSRKCINALFNSPESREKSRETMIERYGVENASQSSELRKRAEETNIRRYGVKNAIQNDSIKRKRAESYLRNLGVENPAQSEEVKEKIRKTSIQRYGTESPLSSPEVREKIARTNLERYGSENPMLSPEVQERKRASCLETYGVENPASLYSVKQKIRGTSMERYGVPSVLQSEEVKEKICLSREKRKKERGIVSREYLSEISGISQEEFSEMKIHQNEEKIRDVVEMVHNDLDRDLTLQEISEAMGVPPSLVKKIAKRFGMMDMFFKRNIPLEDKFRNFLSQNNIQYQMHNRTIISPQEIDFVLDDNLGIEINEMMAHSTYMIKNPYYHSEKTKKAREKGVKLIHIWEWEMIDTDVWKKTSGWILDILNKSRERLFARKCKIQLVSRNSEKEFLEKYHLQGYRKSEICLGLYYENELVQLMSFCKSRFNPNYEWELLRLCTKFGFSVVGGSNRLLENFIKNNHPESIISYCDLSKFTGGIYKKMGFSLLRVNSPSAIWYDEMSDRRFSQQSLVKHGADQLLGVNFGRGTNNEEIVVKMGFKKIFDCGQAVYVRKCN